MTDNTPTIADVLSVLSTYYANEFSSALDAGMNERDALIAARQAIEMRCTTVVGEMAAAIFEKKETDRMTT